MHLGHVLFVANSKRVTQVEERKRGRKRRTVLLLKRQVFAVPFDQLTRTMRHCPRQNIFLLK